MLASKTQGLLLFSHNLPLEHCDLSGEPKEIVRLKHGTSSATIHPDSFPYVGRCNSEAPSPLLLFKTLLHKN